VNAGDTDMKRRSRRDGFTLVEALVAISLAALAGSALLLGTFSTVQATGDAEDQTIALGMAQQLMDEVVGNPYIASGGNAYAAPIGPLASQRNGASRALFRAIGDFNGYRALPPRDPWGVALGTDDGQGGTRAATFQAATGRFANWRQEVDVYYVKETDLKTALTGSTTSDYRAVEVRINYVDPQTGVTRTLAQLRRVVAYVPALL
jgi:type II secretory pathway pseudopilin PulG